MVVFRRAPSGDIEHEYYVHWMLSVGSLATKWYWTLITSGAYKSSSLHTLHYVT